jgi:hypothetical protein
MNSTVLIIILALILLAVAFMAQQWSMLRAAKTVIKIFRKCNAVGIQNARSLEELRLQPKAWYLQFRGLRDFKPTALRMLLENGIVQTTEDGRLYLSEDNLAATRLKDT